MLGGAHNLTWWTARSCHGQGQEDEKHGHTSYSPKLGAIQFADGKGGSTFWKKP
jgi:hypothetical protein